METKRKRCTVYTLLSIAILFINLIIIVISQDRIAITKYSIISLVFAFCSVVYAIIAISLREHFNLFFLNLYIIAKLFNKSYNQTQEYKDNFFKFAFVYCASIPFYITLSLSVDNFYSGIMRPLEVNIVQTIAIILLGIIPPMIKNISNQKQQRLKDEADRKEQEQRESMGKWK